MMDKGMDMMDSGMAPQSLHVTGLRSDVGPISYKNYEQEDTQR